MGLALFSDSSATQSSLPNITMAMVQGKNGGAFFEGSTSTLVSSVSTEEVGRALSPPLDMASVDKDEMLKKRVSYEIARNFAMPELFAGRLRRNLQTFIHQYSKMRVSSTHPRSVIEWNIDLWVKIP